MTMKMSLLKIYYVYITEKSKGALTPANPYCAQASFPPKSSVFG